MDTEIERATRRPWRYWYEDGLTEIGMGAIMVALGLVFLFETWLPAGPAHTLISMLGPLVAVVGVGLLAQRVIRAAKRRLTYPRAGYVAYRRQSGGRLAQRLALGVAVGALVGTFSALPSLEMWIPALIGLIIGGALLFGGHRLGLPRFYLLAAASTALGTLASLAGLGDLLGGAAYFVGFGLAAILSGAVTLRAFLGAVPFPGEAQEHDG